MIEKVKNSIASIAKGFKSLFTWLRSIPSEPNGTGSASRVVKLSVVFVVCGIMTGFFILKHELPSREQLFGLSALVTAAQGGYIANKLKSGPDGGPPDEPGEGQ